MLDAKWIQCKPPFLCMCVCVLFVCPLPKTAKEKCIGQPFNDIIAQPINNHDIMVLSDMNKNNEADLDDDFDEGA